MAEFTICNEPIITSLLAKLRNKNTTVADFRHYIKVISTELAARFLNNIDKKNETVQTPLEDYNFENIQTKDLYLVIVLRAGLGMMDAFVKYIPDIPIGIIGIYRDHATLEPKVYFDGLSDKLKDKHAIVLDPMLATGGSLRAAIDQVKKYQPRKVSAVCIVGVKEGVDEIKKFHNDVEIFLAALDPVLNDKGYIVPGLGDAGDRIFDN